MSACGTNRRFHTSTCSAICQGVIDLNAQISDCAFDLGMADQKLDSHEIAGAPGCSCTSQ